jgi:hypothetical protein
LTGKKISFNHGNKQRSTVSFNRPESSRILDGLAQDSAAYKEAVTLIKIGAERLKITPRADMPGFKPGVSYQLLKERYERRLEAERDVYKAIREGWKVYD